MVTSRSLREEEAHEQQWNHPSKPHDEEYPNLQPTTAPRPSPRVKTVISLEARESAECSIPPRRRRQMLSTPEVSGKLELKAKNVEFGSKGFELPVLVPEGCSITWQFQVSGGDCSFAVHEVAAGASRLVSCEKACMVKREQGTCDEDTELRIQQLADFYAEHNPHKKGSVRELVLDYPYRDLVLSLQSQYGALPSGWSSDPMWDEEWCTVKGARTIGAGVSACMLRWETGWMASRRLSYRVVVSDFANAKQAGGIGADAPVQPPLPAASAVAPAPAVAAGAAAAAAAAAAVAAVMTPTPTPAPAPTAPPSGATQSEPVDAGSSLQNATSLAHKQRGTGSSARSQVLDPRDKFHKKIQVASAPTKLTVLFGWNMEGSVDSLDLGVRIWFQGSISGRGQHAPRELMPYSRRKPPKWPQALSMIVQIDEPGTAIVEFDNSYSWMATKVRFSFAVWFTPPPPCALCSPSAFHWRLLSTCSSIASGFHVSMRAPGHKGGRPYNHG